MKKFKSFIFVALAAFMTAISFTACSDDDSDSVAQAVAAGSENSIKFSVGVANGKGTRATPINASNYTTLMKSFGVVMQQVQNGDTSYYYGDATNPIIATNDGRGNFSTASDYYWPKDTAIRFTAYTPVTSDVQLLQQASNHQGLHLKYTVPTDVNKQIDLMYAVSGYNPSFPATSIFGGDNPSAGNFLAMLRTDGIGIAGSANNGIVNLEFRHLLSQVRFTGQASSNYRVVVKSIQVCDVINTLQTTAIAINNANEFDAFAGSDNTGGTLPGGGGLFGAPSKGLSGLSNYPVALSSPITINPGEKSSLTDDGNPLMLVPQERAAQDMGMKTGGTMGRPIDYGCYLKIECQVYDIANKKDLVGSISKGVFSTIYVPFQISWKEGYAYNYILNFDGKNGFGTDEDGKPSVAKVSYTVSVGDWKNGRTGEWTDTTHKTHNDNPNPSI